MGLFLQVMIIPACKKEEAKTFVKTVAEKCSRKLHNSKTADTIKYDIVDLCPDECEYKESADGVSILINNGCIGYGALAGAISEECGKAVLILYIYDGDYWAYELYDNGEEIDQFDPIPDYFGEVSEKAIQKFKGNADIIAKYFSVDKAGIEKYLIFWSDTSDEKAYEDDEFGYSDWQMADFMRKLGYPYEFGEDYTGGRKD